MRHMYKKRAQAGSGAATLVALIACFIILYILFLPPEDREELLEGDGDDDDDEEEKNDINRTAVEESPGRLDVVGFNEYEHSLPSINLFATTSAIVIKEIDSLYVKNGLFDKSFKKIEFGLEDLENTEKVLLSFFAKIHKGILIIRLNGNTIATEEVINNADFALDKEYLADNNELEFDVSGVGWRFWTTNQYLLEDIQVVGDVTDISEQESKSIFTISGSEKDNLNRAFLKFSPDCTPRNVGKLNVYVNNFNVYSAVPDCGSLTPVEFSTGHLNEGENKVVFQTDEGSYLIDQIMIKTELKEPTYPVYYFELDDDEYDAILDDELDVNLTFRFADDKEFKQATVYVNGHRTILNTYDNEYSRNIDHYVNRGHNAVKIEPEHNTLDVIEFKILLLQ